jgi:hypothetical protein
MIRIKLAMVAVMLIAVLAAKGEVMLPLVSRWFLWWFCQHGIACRCLVQQQQSPYSNRELHMQQHSSCHCSTLFCQSSAAAKFVAP